jgi:hypothetical protein
MGANNKANGADGKFDELNKQFSSSVTKCSAIAQAAMNLR